MILSQTISSFNDNYWRQNHSSSPYAEQGINYEDYQAAYEVGHEGCDRYFDKSFEEAEFELQRDYEAVLAQQGVTGLDWNSVKDAARDAWNEARTT